MFYNRFKLICSYIINTDSQNYYKGIILDKDLTLIFDITISRKKINSDLSSFIKCINLKEKVGIFTYYNSDNKPDLLNQRLNIDTKTFESYIICNPITLYLFIFSINIV